jgi:hypothetical protein
LTGEFGPSAAAVKSWVMPRNEQPINPIVPFDPLSRWAAQSTTSLPSCPACGPKNGLASGALFGALELPVPRMVTET